MTLYSPFDFQSILFNDVAGSVEIFSFLALIALGFAFKKLGLNEMESLSLFALFTIIMSLYLPAIYVLVNILAGIITFFALSKIGR